MNIAEFVRQLHQPLPTSHKGQNGKVLIIGGSDLFHAASQWSFQVAARLVDMVFYSSVAENNELLRDAKLFGHDGVIVPRAELPNYAQEAAAILIGPGMRRDYSQPVRLLDVTEGELAQLSPDDWENNTAAVTATMLRAYAAKQWVIDAGALQMVQPAWLPPHAILTPHWQELAKLLHRLPNFDEAVLMELRETMAHLTQVLVLENNRPAQVWDSKEFVELHRLQPALTQISKQLNGAVLLIKGALDLVGQNESWVVVDGGNAAMTKGGTGDALAGLAVGLAATSPPLASAVVASLLNKQAGYELWQRQGSMFSTTDLVNQLPLVWQRMTNL